MDIHRLDLDLHRLDLRFADTRLVDGPAVDRIARSIEQCGQIVPCIAVRDGDRDIFVLVDGFRRVTALRRLGYDRASIEQWDCAIAEALLAVLARTQDRPFAAIEEALLLKELINGSGLSQHEVGRRCGRDHSWVNRRLALLSALPDRALAAVRDGRLSVWSAARVLCPVARANGDHADRLLTALEQAPLSTRDLGRWFEEYRKAGKAVRARMVEQPGLLLDALKERDELRDGAKLGRGPEGECANDLQIIEAVMARLRKRLTALGPIPAFLKMAAARLRAAMSALTYEIERCSDEDTERDPASRADPGRSRKEPT
jgi:ParB-like chromosome segregation protein Spo0J